jgi:hypothetical protein
VVREVFLANSISSFLISNGPKASYFLRVRMSAMNSSCRYGPEKDDHLAKDFNTALRGEMHLVG